MQKKKLIACLLILIFVIGAVSTAHAAYVCRYCKAPGPISWHDPSDPEHLAQGVFSEGKTENGIHYIRYGHLCWIMYECKACHEIWGVEHTHWGSWQVDSDWPY